MFEWVANNAGSIVTVGFSGAFTLIMLWTYWPTNKNKMQEQAMIPFHEEQKNG